MAAAEEKTSTIKGTGLKKSTNDLSEINADATEGSVSQKVI